MKKVIKIVSAFFIVIAFSFLNPGKSKLVGRWIIFTADNRPSKEYVDFKKDGTYNVLLPDGRVGEIGFYKLENSVFSIKNAKAKACGDNYWGTYKITFYGKDSLTFAVIKDSCSNRRNDIVGGNPGLRRFKVK